jgi:class 3 adenylate cyclase
MKPGSIVEFLEEEGLLCGVVLEFKREHLRVLAQDGREMTLSPKSILQTGPILPLAGMSRNDLWLRLKKTAQTREELKNSIDLENLWEFLAQEDIPPLTIEDMADLWFGGASPDRVAAMARSLREDRLLFRSKEGQMVANPPELVEKLKRTSNEPLQKLYINEDKEIIKQAKDENRMINFAIWAGGKNVSLAIVFTDMVGSTELGQELGDYSMAQLRMAHFAQCRLFVEKHRGYELKTIGDSIMAAFRSASDALDFAIDLQAAPGHARIHIRAGIHIGPVQVQDYDAFGSTVDLAARVAAAIKRPGILLSNRAKEDVDQLRAEHHRSLTWRGFDVELKGFPQKHTIFMVT